jgi:hypothetical protein
MEDLSKYREPVKDRFMLLYKHHCTKCGWEAYRDFKMEGLKCSVCGTDEPPEVTTVERPLLFESARKEIDALVERLGGMRVTMGQLPTLMGVFNYVGLLNLTDKEKAVQQKNYY